MEAIRFENVTRRFRRRDTRSLKELLLGIAGHRPTVETINAVDDVSFSIDEGEAVALLGHNGSGKSTSLRMIAGIIEPSSGVVRARGHVVALLELGAGFHPDLTGRENVFLAGAVMRIPRLELQRRFDDIVQFAGVEDALDIPLKFYSSGMVARLGFSVAVFRTPDIMLIDEILSVGDGEYQRRSFQRLKDIKDQGSTIVLVTHQLEGARRLCERQLVLDHGRLVFDGPLDPTEEDR